MRALFGIGYTSQKFYFFPKTVYTTKADLYFFYIGGVLASALIWFLPHVRRQVRCDYFGHVRVPIAYVWAYGSFDATSANVRQATNFAHSLIRSIKILVAGGTHFLLSFFFSFRDRISELQLQKKPGGRALQTYANTTGERCRKLL